MTILFLLFIGCDIPEEIYDNPLDLDLNAEKGITPPALVFNPNEISANSGSNVTIQVFALEVNNVAGSHIQVSYDKNKLSLASVTLGELFNAAQDPLFFYENNPTSGVLDIYTSFLGDDTSVSGTGTLAYLVFSATAPGITNLQITSISELVDPDDNPIQLNGLGQGVVNAN